MDTFINPVVSQILDGINIPQVLVKIMRRMFDGKMAGILSGAGGANC